MPRWPAGYKPRVKQTCPKCGGRKDFYASECRKCKVYPKPLLGVKGSSHPTWKGGYRIDRDGYIRTYAPDHPWPRIGGYVRENDRVMELHIGRRLLPDEVVHHKNENKLDNRLENLELTTFADHSVMHRNHDKHLYIRDPETGRYTGKEVQHAG